MKSLIYLYKRSFINRVKKALHKPITYLYVIGVLAYVVFIIFGFGQMFSGMGIDNPQGFVTILSFFILVSIPSNILIYARKKGLIFKPSDVNFVFSSPVNPKQVLLYAQTKQYILSFILALIFCIGGVWLFHLSPVLMVIYFIAAVFIENIMEASLMILIFGNETISEKGMTVLRNLVKIIIAVLVLLGVYLLFTEGKSLQLIQIYLNHPFLQMIPLIGWNIAFIRLLILGPTTLNIICTILYLATTLLLFILAKKMKCTGEYYEEAMTFAEDYEAAMKKSRKGEVAFVGKKKKYKAAKVEYKGDYAKAIFYRQILEYKKNRFFIFGPYSLLCLGVGVAVAIFAYQNLSELSGLNEYIIPGVGAYLTFIFSAYTSKWGKELENPYTYLLPDSSLKKLWYATLIEHIRALIDGCLIAIPVAVVLKISVIQFVLSVLIYVCLQANKLYMNVLAEAVIGNLLGTVGKQILRMLGQGIVMAAAIIAAIIGSAVFRSEVGFILLLIVTVAFTAIIAIGASVVFNKMEAVDA